MSNLTKTRAEEIAHARAVDAKLEALWSIYWTAQDKVLSVQKRIAEHKKMVGYYRSNPTRGAYYEERIAELEAKLPDLTTVAGEAQNAAHLANDDLYGGWSRFFLVKHIHSSMSCSSFRPTTKVGWLPELSGQTETEAVAEHGAILCTICFPTAPTEWTAGKQADANICTGTRDHSAPSRTGYYTGNWATCTCGQTATLTSAGNLRKHKKAAA